MPTYAPAQQPRPARRLTGNLAVGAATANTVAISEDVPIAGAAKVKARIKVTNTGTLDMTFGFYNPAGVFTAYTTGNPTQVAVSANTEAQISSDTYGEDYVRVTFTGTATGAITYCDVSQV